MRRRSEVQAPVQRLGRFVVVDRATAKLSEPADRSAMAAPVAAARSGSMFEAPSGSASTSADATTSVESLSGTWQGLGPHQAFTLSLVDSKFTVSRDGRVVREGQFTVTPNTLALADAAGRTEQATVTLAGDEMTLDSPQSGVARWRRTSPAPAETVPSGFFSTVQAPETPPGSGAAPPASTKPAPASKPRANTSQTPRTPTGSLASAAPPVETATADEPKKKNVFQRIGSGIKSAATGVVHGVQNLGKSSAQQTAVAASATVAQSEQQLAAGVDAAGAQLTNAAQGVQSAALGNCNQILGDWVWFVGGTVTFSEKDRVRWSPVAGTGAQPASGTWHCVPATGLYTVTWQNGLVDTLQLAANGMEVNGMSSNGVDVSGRRSSGGGSANTAGTVSPSNPAGGWTPIGNGGFGKQSTVPMSGGIPQRIGPQGRPPPKGAG